jgi:hypothetical protein
MKKINGGDMSIRPARSTLNATLNLWTFKKRTSHHSALRSTVHLKLIPWKRQAKSYTPTPHRQGGSNMETTFTPELGWHEKQSAPKKIWTIGFHGSSKKFLVRATTKRSAIGLFCVREDIYHSSLITCRKAMPTELNTLEEVW